ncbi:hypothetical protein BURPS1106B_A1980 [Burkholderia pseudomallei 1106b]|uniref:Uncharacterized protein n=1 Tax=Burkholderia pseudomallei (strain 1106a) TaxID=357348 RepID=A3NXD9_BURP0|nr:hypothetical protein BURPS1106A_2758 [Burkholderia pseudomallei 1106a]ACQ98146.1 conserved hypothetical protein [Burkholderia pseudomallei MSHR346]EES25435.1 hypothetical protein BURPS1106B_A1980 [Burkholderia pseudomallei 1106b]
MFERRGGPLEFTVGMTRETASASFSIGDGCARATMRRGAGMLRTAVAAVAAAAASHVARGAAARSNAARAGQPALPSIRGAVR